MIDRLRRMRLLAVTCCAVLASASAQERPASTPSSTLRLFKDAARPPEPEWLAENLRRRDPEQDGWPSEAFHDRARPILERFLDALAKAPESADELAPFLASEFAGQTALRPAELAVVFDDGNTIVRRLEAAPASALLPCERLPAVVAELLAPFAGAETIGHEEWITAIEAGAEGTWRTRVLAKLYGSIGEKRVAQNIEWDVAWAPSAEEGRPGVASIALASFEEVSVIAPLYAEITRYAFGAHPWFEAQMLRGEENSYFHQDRLTGNDVLGGHGFAVGDVDGDGYDDVYMAMPAGIPNRLLMHTPDGTARDRATAWGVAFLDSTRSALIVDLDNDGKQDLALAIGANVLLCFNSGQGAFDPMVWLKTGSPEEIFSLSAADPDGDSDLDLYACRYVVSGLMGGVPLPYFDASNGATNFYWRNEGERKFVDATAEVGLDQNNNRYSLASLWEDLDGDGDLDLYVTNDFGRSNLYLNEGGRFRDAPQELGIDERAASMGITCADVELDGDLDLYISNMWSAAGQRIVTQEERFQDGKHPELAPVYLHHARGNTLLLNDGGRYRDATAASGSARGGWAWGALFTDFQNDGLPDIVVPNGFVTLDGPGDIESFFWRRVIGQSPPNAEKSPPYRQAWASIQHMVMTDRWSYNGNEKNCAFLNIGGARFADVSAASGIDFVDDGRAAATVDWDDDGKLDLLLKNRTGPVLRLMHNRSTVAGNYVSVELAGTHCNRDAIGARVTVELANRQMVKTLYAGEGYLAQSSKRLHFGLGKVSEIARLSVRWPDGSEERFTKLAVNTRYRIVQGAGRIEGLPARRSAPVASASVETLTRDPRPNRRVVLVDKLPLGELQIPSLLGGERRVRDLPGQLLLISFWTSRGPRTNLENLLAQHDELDVHGITPVIVSVDEGVDLARTRKLLIGTRLSENAGYADGACLQALEPLLFEVYGRSDVVPLPVSLMVDSLGQLCVIYEGELDFVQLAKDAKSIRGMAPKNRSTVRLSGGRWLARGERDLAQLAKIYDQLGRSEMAAFYKGLAEQEKVPESER